MRRLMVLYLALALSTAFGVDMRHRFGMGVAWTTGQSGLAPIDGLMKYGLSEWIVLEPTLHLTTTTTYTDGRSTYDLSVAAVLAYVVRANARTNVYAKAGLGFASRMPDNEEYTSSLLVPLGLGLEHFVSDHFSVDLDARMGLVSTWGYGDQPTDLTLGNKVLGAGLLWYY
jgi:hypothetical protein